MSWRYTVEVLRSGQPRPYADHHNRVRLTIEVLSGWGLSLVSFSKTAPGFWECQTTSPYTG